MANRRPWSLSRSTNRHESLYNLRVAFDRTYFVGSRQWGFSLWAHNAYSIESVVRNGEEVFQVINTETKEVKGEFASLGAAQDFVKAEEAKIAAARAAEAGRAGRPQRGQPPEGRAGAGRSDPHGHAPGQALLDQLAAAQRQLEELTRNQGPLSEKTRLRNLIVELKKKIAQVQKGETHWRRGR